MNHRRNAGSLPRIIASRELPRRPKPIKQYELAVSSDRKTWTAVKSGTLPNKGELNTATIDQPVTFRYARLIQMHNQVICTNKSGGAV